MRRTNRDVALDMQAKKLVQWAARFLRHAQLQADALPIDVQRLLRTNGLAMRHLHALFPLAIEGPMVVNHLAERLALAPASTSQLVGELHRAGLVTRRVDMRDRRRAVIDIRNDLRSRVAAVARGRLRPFRATLARLSPREREQFLNGWQILIESLEEDNADQRINYSKLRRG